MRRITKAAVGSLVGGVLVMSGTQTAIGDSVRQLFAGTVTDLVLDPDGRVPPDLTTTNTGAFDSAEALLKVTETSDGPTTLWIRVKGIDIAGGGVEGKTFGSHLHTGTCDANVTDPLDRYNQVGPHYKRPQQDAQTLREKEVWFDFIPNEQGVAVDKVVVPGALKDLAGAHSIVIHARATDEGNGAAGPKEVCLPLALDTES